MTLPNTLAYNGTDYGINYGRQKFYSTRPRRYLLFTLLSKLV